MRKINTLLSILSLLSVIGCSVDEKCENMAIPSVSEIALSPAEWTSIAYDNPKEVSDEDIVTIINDFIGLEYVAPANLTRTENSINSLKQSVKYSLSEKTPIVTTRNNGTVVDHVDCSICEYDLELGGEKYNTVVCIDERFPKVLAFTRTYGDELESDRVDNPTYDPSQSIINLSYEALYHHLHEIEIIRDSLRNNTLLKISRMLNKPVENISFEKIKDHISVIDTDTSTRSLPSVLPFDPVIGGCWPLSDINLMTDYGFTKMKAYMPYYWGTSRVGVEDCTAAAVHILAATREKVFIPARTYNGHGYLPSMNVDWNLLAQTSPSARKDEMLGRLIRLINDEAGFIYSDATPNSYSINGKDKIENFYRVLQRYMICNPIRSYNLDAIITSLIKGYPIFVSHFTASYVEQFMTIDGYLKTRTLFGNIDTYLHVRLLGNDSAGYYYVNTNSSFSMESSYSDMTFYSEKMKIIPECRSYVTVTIPKDPGR